MEIIEKISFGDEKFIPALKELWKNNFCNDEEYINNYFDNFYKDTTCLVMLYNNTAVGSLHYTVTDAYYKGEFVRGAYIYAAVVEKKWRNYGIFTALHKKMKSTLAEDGFSFIYTSANSPSYFDFFKKLGYKAVFRKNYYKISKFKKIFGLNFCDIDTAYQFYRQWSEEKKGGFCLIESIEDFKESRKGYDTMSYLNCSAAVFEEGRHNYLIGEYAAPRSYGIPKIMFIDKSEKSGLILPITNKLDIGFIEKQHPYLNYPLNRKEYT